MKPAPMPWILCGDGAGFCPASVCVMTGLFAGSTATETSGFPFVSLMWRETPVIVPPVPTPETRTSIAPPVSSQISGPVVHSWMAGLAGFLNCCGMNHRCGSDATVSSARRIAPGMPSGPGVSTSCAPKAARTFRRSMLIVSGMVSVSP
jgi:hypothetical protein